jgi:hypothetical protein
VLSGRSRRTFRRNILPPSSGLKNTLSKSTAWSMQQLHISFLWYIGWLSPGNIAYTPDIFIVTAVRAADPTFCRCPAKCPLPYGQLPPLSVFQIWHKREQLFEINSWTAQGLDGQSKTYVFSVVFNFLRQRILIKQKKKQVSKTDKNVASGPKPRPSVNMLPVFMSFFPAASKSPVFHGGRLEKQHFVRIKKFLSSCQTGF